jgi:hypothetical protein
MVNITSATSAPEPSRLPPSPYSIAIYYAMALAIVAIVACLAYYAREMRRRERFAWALEKQDPEREDERRI